MIAGGARRSYAALTCKAKLKERQTNVVMAPKTDDDTISDLNIGAF